jgi:diaminopimelate epimerase
MMQFRKMHGCGNDFVVMQTSTLTHLLGQPQALREFVRRLCDRHYGVGGDGLLAWESQSTPDGLHIRMQYWNADGSRAEMCGNGARCVVRDAWEDAGQPDIPVQLHTDNGVRAVRIEGRGDDCVVAVDMGVAEWQPALVPFTAEEVAVDIAVDVPGLTYGVSALSIGNPHAIVFVEDRAKLDSIDLQQLGEPLSTHRRFPRGANASFVCVANGSLHLRVWERGVGPTLACGTASCAALAAARRSGRLTSKQACVQLPGGQVHVQEAEDGHLWLAGPASSVASGSLGHDWLLSVSQRRPD